MEVATLSQQQEIVEQTGKSATPFGSVREKRTQGKSLSPRLEREIGEYKESWLTSAETQKKNRDRKQCQDGKLDL